MVPEGYDEFFVATATVAGALIGLLFVAISVRPEAAARTAHITVRLRAVAGLSAFLDTLFVSLLALRPHADLGGIAFYLGLIGLVSMVTLLLLLGTQGRDRPWPMARGALLVVGQGVLFVLQVFDGTTLMAHPTDAAPVDNITVLIVVLFALGITRTWEFAGADNPSLLGTAVTTIVGTSTASGHDAAEQRPDGSTSAPSSVPVVDRRPEP